METELSKIFGIPTPVSVTGAGFELIEYIASLYDCQIEIIDHTEQTEEQEPVEDLVQIVTVFSCKLQGKRANKAKKLVKELADKSLQNPIKPEQ